MSCDIMYNNLAIMLSIHIYFSHTRTCTKNLFIENNRGNLPHNHGVAQSTSTLTLSSYENKLEKSISFLRNWFEFTEIKFLACPNVCLTDNGLFSHTSFTKKNKFLKNRLQ